MDMELPEAQPVHVFSADLQGVAAIQATGNDGEQYCIIDSTVIVGNPEARNAAQAVYVKAREVARRRRSTACAT